MKFLAEYRDPAVAEKYFAAIRDTVTKPWTIMEVCGGQTNTIVRYGIDEQLPKEITLVHGPGCPICVTPVEMIDRALIIAERSEVIFCSFGDMIRVPGSRADLQRVKAEGGDVRVVYSPLDAVRIARENPSKEVVFFAVGFETTAPANAMALLAAKNEGLSNFSMIVSHVLVPPMLEVVCNAKDNRVAAFLAAGHVCTVEGVREYRPIAEKHRVPIVATGFEPMDILQGVLMAVRQLEEGRAEVEIQYGRSVREDGNELAREIVSKVFTRTKRKWRGIGTVGSSGLELREEFASFDASRKFDLADFEVEENENCLSGRILIGELKPTDCPAFGVSCTPETPLGATMVSAEGACAAYYRYRSANSSFEIRNS
ncbi:MAG: hydrogenase formation protein HypD [Planctomycetes bacterium]|nr:hydrogenase formation protein HypD [Planctomycetota bacterium]